MNECFVVGRIISGIGFKFVLDSKNIAVALFKVELSNKSIIDVKGYNEYADYCYSQLSKEDVVFIYGYLNLKMELIIKNIEKL